MISVASEKGLSGFCRAWAGLLLAEAAGIDFHYFMPWIHISYIYVIVRRFTILNHIFIRDGVEVMNSLVFVCFSYCFSPFISIYHLFFKIHACNLLYQSENILPVFWPDFLSGLYLINSYFVKTHIIKRSQHDVLEPNLKTTLHRNGIWGLEVIVMQFH